MHNVVTVLTEYAFYSLSFQKCFVLDSGHGGLFVWTGKECSNDFKKTVWDSVEVKTSSGEPENGAH